jgi:anaerobic ribonucleoside-triphosphate reductase activating protein
MHVRIHALEPASRANGPGLRAVVWFQGCTLNCPGCFNPSMHDPNAGYEADTAAVVRQMLGSNIPVEGVSVSGGEPFQQPEALLDLVQRVKNSGQSVLVFTGYNLGELHEMSLGRSILRSVDVLVAGRYLRARHLGHGLLGSANQKIHCLTARYQPRDFADSPASEVILHRDGSITLSGVVPRSLGDMPSPNGDDRPT